MNANMITSLQNSILAYGTEEFAELYRDFIIYYRKEGEKKIRIITKGLSGTYKKLTKKDIS
jgi:RNase P/RNase MRP subunit POP5